MEIFNTKKGLLLSGVIVGILVAILAYFGNPANMALCVACFIRDTAGALGLHGAANVQYFRPEIVGFVGGAFLLSVATKEYRSTAGSSPMTRFILGFIMMIGALVFLGCPLRMIIRISAGDLNALVGLPGFVLGILTGTFFLKKGYSLGREYETNKMAGAVLPVALVILLIISVTTSLFAVSEAGPGSASAPWLLSLAAALIIGALAQKARICFAGSIRNIFVMKDFGPLCAIAGLFLVMLIYNVAIGNFALSFAKPIAHSQHLWNILGLYAVGFAATLAGGCPLRQLILTGQGSSDAAMTFLGMLIGAAFAHNFGLASAAASEESVGGPANAGKIVLVAAIIVLFIIGFFNMRKKES